MKNIYKLIALMSCMVAFHAKEVNKSLDVDVFINLIGLNSDQNYSGKREDFSVSVGTSRKELKKVYKGGQQAYQVSKEDMPDLVIQFKSEQEAGAHYAFILNPALSMSKRADKKVYLDVIYNTHMPYQHKDAFILIKFDIAVQPLSYKKSVGNFFKQRFALMEYDLFLKRNINPADMILIDVQDAINQINAIKHDLKIMGDTLTQTDFIRIWNALEKKKLVAKKDDRAAYTNAQYWLDFKMDPKKQKKS